jgi:hypothetical protein
MRYFFVPMQLPLHTKGKKSATCRVTDTPATILYVTRKYTCRLRPLPIQSGGRRNQPGLDSLEEATVSSHGAQARGMVAENEHLFPSVFLASPGASERHFSRPPQGSNGMRTANTFAATRSTGSRTVAIHKRPVGADKDEGPPGGSCRMGCAHRFTREKRHWWVQSTHPTFWSADLGDPRHESCRMGCAHCFTREKRHWWVQSTHPTFWSTGLGDPRHESCRMGCAHRFTREKRHWWVQSTHPTFWSADLGDPRHESCRMGCAHRFTREKRHWWVQSTHPTFWSTDLRGPPRESKSCAVVLKKSLSAFSASSAVNLFFWLAQHEMGHETRIGVDSSAGSGILLLSALGRLAQTG